MKKKSKKGLSEIVGYVLLIVIAISLSLVVYSWLKYQLPTKVTECQSGVSISIENYTIGENISITIKNRGLFDIEGVIFKIADEPGIPVISLNGDNYFIEGGAASLRPNEVYTGVYANQYVEILEIQAIPIKVINNEVILCDNAIVNKKIG